MTTNDELARLGEPPVTPEEEAAALHLDELLERRRRGDEAAQAMRVGVRIEPEIEKTIELFDLHVRRAIAGADAYELEELGDLADRVPPGSPSTAAAPDKVPPKIPGYKSLKLIDEGGMGVVWLVRDLRFK